LLALQRFCSDAVIGWEFSMEATVPIRAALKRWTSQEAKDRSVFIFELARAWLYTPGQY